jgi:hypothetical protein
VAAVGSGGRRRAGVAVLGVAAPVGPSGEGSELLGLEQEQPILEPTGSAH